MCRVLIKDLSFRYCAKGDYVLNNLNLAVEEGEFVAVIGHNGSGKSTLAKLMNGLLQPTQGEVCVGDYRTGDKQSLFEIRKRVGVVFQNPDNQLVASIVEDDVAFGAENIGLPREEIFVTSKVWNTDRGYQPTLAAFEKTMTHLGLDYLDLYLIHWPAYADKYDNWEDINRAGHRCF